MYRCKYAVAKTQHCLFLRDFLRSKAENRATAWSSVSIRQFTCLICKEKNFSPKSLLRLRLLQSLMMTRMTAQVQTCIFDLISKKGNVWSAEVVICQKLTHGTINQAVLKAVQSQRTSFESSLEFQNREIAYQKNPNPLFASVPLGSFNTLFTAHVLRISSIYHQRWVQQCQPTSTLRLHRCPSSWTRCTPLLSGTWSISKNKESWSTAVFEKMEEVLRHLEINSLTLEEALSKIFYR